MYKNDSLIVIHLQVQNTCLQGLKLVCRSDTYEKSQSENKKEAIRFLILGDRKYIILNNLKNVILYLEIV